MTKDKDDDVEVFADEGGNFVFRSHGAHLHQDFGELALSLFGTFECLLGLVRCDFSCFDQDGTEFRGHR